MAPQFMRKAATYLGLNEDDEMYEAYGQDEAYAEAAVEGVGAVERHYQPEVEVADDYAAYDVEPERAIERDLATIACEKPTHFNDAKAIGETLREGIPVIMDLSGLDDGMRRRLVDFASGLAFGVHGSIDRISNGIFLLAPQHVKVTADAARRAAAEPVFNQS